MAEATSSQPFRRSARVNIAWPVRIMGTFRDNQPFREDTQVLTISKFGAKLKSRLPLQVGMQLKMELIHGGNVGLFKVVWVGSEGTPRAGEVGVECAEKGAGMPGVTFPD